MKKRIIAMALASFMLASFAACGRETGGDLTTTSNDVSSAADETVRNDAVNVNYEEIYKPVIQKYYDFVSIDMYWDSEEEGMNGIAESKNYHTLDTTGYLLKDLSGDGIPELIITEIDENMKKEGRSNNMLAVYSVDDNEPELVIESWSRNTNHLMQDGSISYYGSGGYVNYGFGTYRLSENGEDKVWSEFYVRNGNVFSKNTSGDWEEENPELISEEDFNQKFAQYYDAEGIYIDSTPLREFDSAEYGKNPVLKAEYAKDSKINPDDCEEYEFENGSETIIISTNDTVRDFRLMEISLVEADNENGYAFYGMVLYSSYLMTPDEPLAINPQFMGDSPEYGFSYVDGNGERKSFSVMISGEDGSLVTSPIELAESDY